MLYEVITQLRKALEDAVQLPVGRIVLDPETQVFVSSELREDMSALGNVTNTEARHAMRGRTIESHVTEGVITSYSIHYTKLYEGSFSLAAQRKRTKRKPP